MNKNNKSGYTGVCWHSNSQKYQVHICVSSKRLNIGYCANLDDAIALRLAAEAILEKEKNIYIENCMEKIKELKKNPKS